MNARLCGWLAWLIPATVYVLSVPRGVGYWDTGEMQVVPWIFGIGHPTGFPVFTIAAGIFAHLVAIGPVSWRVGLFCALASATSAWLVSRIVLLLADDCTVAMGSSWLFAFGIVAWTRGARAELHALALLFALLAIYAGLRWWLYGEAKSLSGGALAFGLGIATHPIVGLLLPAIAVVLVASRRRLTPRLLAGGAGALLLGLAFYAYLPLRSAAVDRAHLDPTSRIGLPAGRSFWDTDDPSTLAGLEKMITGSQFHTGNALRAVFTAQPYDKNGESYMMTLFEELTPIGLLLAGGGALALRRRPAILVMLAVAAFFPTAFALAYPVVVDVDRYYLISFAVAAVLAGVGGCALLRLLPEYRRGFCLVPAALGLILLGLNHAAPAQQPQADAVIRKVLARTPADAVLIASWQVATPLAYAAYVENRLQHRILDAAWLADDARYVPGWLRSRPVYVIGTRYGHVPGYHLHRIATGPNIYRIEPTP